MPLQSFVADIGRLEGIAAEQVRGMACCGGVHVLVNCEAACAGMAVGVAPNKQKAAEDFRVCGWVGDLGTLPERGGMRTGRTLRALPLSLWSAFPMCCTDSSV